MRPNWLKGRKLPIEIARERGYHLARGFSDDSNKVIHAVLKFRFGNVVHWEDVARDMKRPVAEVGWALFSMQVDLIMRRKTTVTVAEVERTIGRGASALLNSYGIAHRTGDILVFNDVGKTVGESLMRRAQGLRQLPKTRARNLRGKLADMHSVTRGRALPFDENAPRVVELLRARATDKEICRRWELALASKLPKIRTLSDFMKHWNNLGA